MLDGVESELGAEGRCTLFVTDLLELWKPASKRCIVGIPFSIVALGSSAVVTESQGAYSIAGCSFRMLIRCVENNNSNNSFRGEMQNVTSDSTYLQPSFIYKYINIYG